MTVSEFHAVLDAADANGLDRVTLVVGKRKNPGDNVRLLPRGGPVGHLCCVNSNGECVGSFKIAAVRRWLERVAA